MALELMGAGMWEELLRPCGCREGQVQPGSDGDTGPPGVVQEQPPLGKGYLEKYGWRKENFLMILCFGADQPGLCHFRKDPKGME